MTMADCNWLRPHRFTRWSEPKVMTVVVNPRTAAEFLVERDVQERICEKCGYVERRVIMEDGK